jgi:hypothetical protein
MPSLSFYDGVHYADVTKFQMIFIEKVEDVAVILLLPLFCVHGIETEIGLINDPYLWKVTGTLYVCCH